MVLAEHLKINMLKIPLLILKVKELGGATGVIKRTATQIPISTSDKVIDTASTILAGYERTNMTGFNADNGVLSTYSPYVNKKYEEFIEENGHIPEFFNPYNKSEITDIAPTLTAQGDSITKSGTILKCDMRYRIRKLTPKECWRLMGFTDEDFEKAEKVNSNTQLCKQAGNSIVKDVLMAIFREMM